MSPIQRKRTDRRRKLPSGIAPNALAALTILMGMGCGPTLTWAGLPDRRVEPDRRVALDTRSYQQMVRAIHSPDLLGLSGTPISKVNCTADHYAPFIDQVTQSLNRSSRLYNEQAALTGPVTVAQVSDIESLLSRLSFPQNHLAYMLLLKAEVPSASQLSAALAEDVRAIRNQESIDQLSLGRSGQTDVIRLEYAKQESIFLAQLRELAIQKCGTKTSRKTRQPKSEEPSLTAKDLPVIAPPKASGQFASGDVVSPPTHKGGVAEGVNRVPSGYDSFIIEVVDPVKPSAPGNPGI